MENNNNDAPQKPGSQETAKNLLLSLLLVALIIGSFWLSYHIGKRFLFTAKRIPEPKIEIAIPEPPEPPAAPAVKPDKEIKQTDEASKKAVKPKAPTVAKTTKTAEAPKKTASKTTTASKQYYKVQAGFFTNKSNALNLIKKLTTQGFSTYLRKLSNGWRVQVGAFKTKTQALSLQRSLGTKGFNSTIIYE
jgi:cell division protein FtsN